MKTYEGEIVHQVFLAIEGEGRLPVGQKVSLELLTREDDGTLITQVLLRPVKIPVDVTGGVVRSMVISSHAVKLFNADASIVAILAGIVNVLSLTMPRIQAAPSDVKFSLSVND